MGTEVGMGREAGCLSCLRPESGRCNVPGRDSRGCLQEEGLRKGDSVGKLMCQVSVPGRGGHDLEPKAPLNGITLYGTGDTSYWA